MNVAIEPSPEISNGAAVEHNVPCCDVTGARRSSWARALVLRDAHVRRFQNRSARTGVAW